MTTVWCDASLIIGCLGPPALLHWLATTRAVDARVDPLDPSDKLPYQISLGWPKDGEGGCGSGSGWVCGWGILRRRIAASWPEALTRHSVSISGILLRPPDPWLSPRRQPVWPGMPSQLAWPRFASRWQGFTPLAQDLEVSFKAALPPSLSVTLTPHPSTPRPHPHPQTPV